MSKTVTVRVQLTGRFEYCQNVEMPLSAFEKFDKLLESSDRKVRQKAERDICGLYVNYRDIEINEDEDELEDFRLAAEGEY